MVYNTLQGFRINMDAESIALGLPCICGVLLNVRRGRGPFLKLFPFSGFAGAMETGPILGNGDGEAVQHV